MAVSVAKQGIGAAIYHIKKLNLPKTTDIEMAKVKPFKGLRPPKELVEQVASRPYDVLNSEEARREAEGNERSL